MTREAGGENLSIPMPDWEAPPTQPGSPLRRYRRRPGWRDREGQITQTEQCASWGLECLRRGQAKPGLGRGQRPFDDLDQIQALVSPAHL